MKQKGPSKTEKTGIHRRNFLSKVASVSIMAGVLTSPLILWVSSVLAKTKKVILPKGTPEKELINRNPAHLDPKNLALTPLSEFGTMGLSDYQVQPDHWRLHVKGFVQTPLSLSYQQILSMPSLERRVLLICPGFFANYGEWKGVSIRHLLQEARAPDTVTHVTISGPQSGFEKTEKFEIKEALEDKIFLAYSVNGHQLPVKHGFPLRLVAEGHYGYNWVKYVDRVRAEIIDS